MVEYVRKEPIAIIGLGCVLPDAPDVETFWSNLQAGKNSIRDVDPARWDPAHYYDANKAPDKTYTKIGAFVVDDAFNGIEYRMPPKVVEQVDNAQRWALAATRQAMIDAGLETGIKGDGGKAFDRDRCAVILGNAMGGETNKLATKRLFWPDAEQALRADADFQSLPAERQEAILRRAEARYKSTTLPVTEDTMPGHLSNVFAGRIANTFDLGGKNFTTDAACASSLAALDSAIDTLRGGDTDMVVWGGADRSMDITPYIQFSAIGALSPDGSRPFDAGANGFVMGEGCAMFILKRLSDAERDGDKIYAVIRGMGSSSDGKGKGITAPNPKGQVKAVQRAYADAEMDPATLGYLEAHGTSTPVGDPVELQSVQDAFGELAVAPGTIKVGSVKSNIGHLKAAAGAAGALKAILALHHKQIPRSINVQTLNPRIEWATSPFAVATQGQDWPEGPTPRRAAVSSFGFGGTNFHVVLQEYIPGAIEKAPAAVAKAAPANEAPMFDQAGFQAYMQDNNHLETQGLVIDGDAPQAVASLPATVAFPETGKGPRLRDLFYGPTRDGCAAERRVGIAPQSIEEIGKKLELAQKAAVNPGAAKLAFQQGVFLNQGKPQGKLAFLFPGQGTQYVNMGRDLAKKYAVIRHTFAEADKVLFDELDGVKLTDILWPTPNTPENQKASNEKLQLTEFTQPAVLAMDVAILRLLKQWNIKPDVVAGHSLGEYGALVAAGVLTFADALHAVAARGREMANVDLPDLGKMASIPADWETVSLALEQVDEYVICANKNCPSQTVIAGSTAGVDAAVKLLTEQGLQCIPLPVSAAFHSDIVAPASGPLRNVLARLDVKSPQVRVLSNVGAQPYPDDPEAIRDNLATQVASAVEWIDIMERMHDEGVRTFIEVGPKKALTGFAMDIFKDRMGAEGPVAICANHPKKGEIQHINELFAFLGAWGFMPQLPALNDAGMYTAEFLDPTAAFQRAAPVQEAGDVRLDQVMDRLAALEAKLGAPTTPASVPAPTALPATQQTAPAVAAPEFGFFTGDIGITGISVGLPGDKPLFSDDNFDRILAGENMIGALPEMERAKIADKNIVRLVKGSDGNARFEVINDVAQVIQLAGRRGDFDISDWGVEGDLASTLDKTFQYAIAAGIEALRDAGIPLQRTYAQTSTGSYLPKAWKLPESMQRETGIIFASAFPGIDNLLRDVSQYLADKYAGRTLDELQQLYQDLLGAIDSPEVKDKMGAWFEGEFDRLQDALPNHGASRYEFNRKFLFNVLSLGHAQLAQFIGAKGPNTQVNAACASTTQAVAMAEDWLRMGRCKRVIVVGADDVTSDAMFEWIGAGFLASGAATTKSDVAEAALPFDARRHGMIVGMGAVGLVIETAPEIESRGMRPIARLLSTQIANSAFHGSRLDIEDIAYHMQQLVTRAGRYGVTPETMAANTVFVSHETYTPARGGSAGAEIHALRATFGDQADKVVIANTKGFTGHPQGAGVEDAISLKMLQRGIVPPIANFRDPDPELGNLNLSKGGSYDVRYALRLAAGFGSQIAMTLTELVAKEDERVANQGQYDAWLGQVSGLSNVQLEVESRTLRIVDQGPPARATTPEPIPEPVEPIVSSTADAGDALERVTAVIAEKTGYPVEMLEADLDMEADLGIDTVKQAELFGELREMFGVPLDESLSLADYNTLRKVAAYMSSGTPSSEGHEATPVADVAAPAAAPDGSIEPSGDALEKVTAVIAEKTGYPVEMLEADLDMEADLGIDTVKQAELFGELREMFGVPMDESLSLADYNTLRKVAAYMSGSGASPAPTSEAASPEDAPVQVPVAQAPSEEVSPDALTTVTKLIAEKTGYPEEMLEADLDLESDLGIDTVKQAELFAELREHFGVPLDESLSLADYNTITKVAGYMSGGSRSDRSPQPSAGEALESAGTARSEVPALELSPAVASEDVAPVESVVGTPKPDPPGDALAKVIELVANKTGYPADMLEPDLDLEADLGIDTVKQAEIFSELREHFGVPLDESLSLADYNTLSKVAGYMSGGTSRSEVPAPEPPADVAIQAAAVATVSDGATRTGVSAPNAVDPMTAPILRRVPVLRAAPSPNHANNLPAGNVTIIGAQDGAPLGALAEHGWAPGDNPVGIIALDLKPRDLDVTAELFEAAKTCKPAFVLIVTHQDGAHGLQSPREANMAALSGLGKALKKEFPGAVVKVVDLHPDLPASLAVEELVSGGRRTEIAFGADGTRYEIDVSPQELEGTPDLAGKTLIVSGGAQGITVELLASIAHQQPNLLLLGRTTVPEEAAEWATWDYARWKQEEQIVMQRMKDAGDKVTPVTLQKALSPMQKAAEVSRNLQRLTDAGAEVVYSAVDVTDEKAVARAVAHARQRFGSVDGVIHAAGMEISKEIHVKDRAQFDLVYGIKKTGFEALMEATWDDPLSLLVGFGSVAGRFGNLGQTDYSAANEWLCKAVKIEAMRRNIKTAFTVAWGPWGEVGMATKGSIMKIMEASGVTPIPTAEGVRHFLAELATPGIRESVVAGVVGAIDEDGQVVDALPDPRLLELRQRMAASPEAFRLLADVEDCGDDHVVAILKMDQARDPYAKDHAIDGVPYLPGVFGFEAFAEATSLLADGVCLGASEVHFLVPVKQLKDRPVTARVHVHRDGKAFACELTTRMVGPDGQERGEPRVHFSANLHFGPAEPALTTKEVPECDGSHTAIYPPFFHGPSFQVLRAAGPLGDESVGAGVLPYAAAFMDGEPAFQAHPLVVEALFQVCGLRTMTVEKRMSLPAGIEKVDILSHDAPDGEYRLWCRFNGKDDNGLLRFDAVAATASGRVLVRILGYTMVETGPVPEAPTVELTEKPAVQQTLEPVEAPNEYEPVPIPLANVDLPETPGVSFAAVNVEEAANAAWFTDEEFAREFAAPKRRAEWLAGRLAVKALIAPDAPKTVTVENEEGGQPIALVDGAPIQAHITITHRDGLAIAALSDAPLGIDLETTEARPASFHEEAFNADEVAMTETPVGAACVWAAKEATFKRIGTGLKQPLRAWTVKPDGAGGASCSGPEGTFAISFFEVDGRVLAISAETADVTVDV